jgi:uncharacterized protein YjbJ (UPF0337 family)
MDKDRIKGAAERAKDRVQKVFGKLTRDANKDRVKEVFGKLTSDANKDRVKEVFGKLTRDAKKAASKAHETVGGIKNKVKHTSQPK